MKLKTQIKACLGVKTFSPILSHYYFRDRMKHKTHPNQQQQQTNTKPQTKTIQKTPPTQQQKHTTQQQKKKL